MFAITIDQRRSRESADRVPELLRDLESYSLVRRFERTAGDEVQGLCEHAATGVDLITSVVKSQAWWVGVGIGSVDEPLPGSVRASRGPALISARAAVERSHRSLFGLSVEGFNATYVETAVQALARIVVERTREGDEAVEIMRSSKTQKEAAERLAISAQAMSSRLRVARWLEEQRLRALTIHLMEEVCSET